MRDRGSEDDLQHHACYVFTYVYLLRHRRTAFQGLLSFRQSTHFIELKTTPNFNKLY